MECYAEVLSIEDDHALVSINGKAWPIPIVILPENSKPGDIISIQAGFCPFKTLSHMK